MKVVVVVDFVVVDFVVVVVVEDEDSDHYVAVASAIFIGLTVVFRCC